MERWMRRPKWKASSAARPMDRNAAAASSSDDLSSAASITAAGTPAATVQPQRAERLCAP